MPIRSYENLLVVRNVVIPVSKGGKSIMKKIIDTTHIKNLQIKELQGQFPGATVNVHIHLRKKNDSGQPPKISTKLFQLTGLRA